MRLPEHSRCLLEADAVQRQIDGLAGQINQRLAGCEPVLMLPVLNGGLWIGGQLLARLECALELDYIHLTRYRESTEGADLQWRAKPCKPLADRHILLVDDILDQGVTARALIDYCRQEGAANVWLAVLVAKPDSCRKVAVSADFVGAHIPDHYVFGCGMDLKGLYRNLPALYYLESSCWQ